MLPELVIFDMAGTTVHDESFVGLCLQDALAAAGAEVPLSAIMPLMGIPKPVAIARLLGTIPGDIDAIHADFVQRMVAFYQNDPRVREIDGATLVFEWLHSKGIKVGLDTGFSRDITDTIIRRLNWAAQLDVSVSSDEVAQGRPAPDMVYRAMEILGLSDTQRVAKVGDTASDLGEGAAAGCGWVIGVTSGAYTAEELQHHPHTHLIHHIGELPELFEQSTR